MLFSSFFEVGKISSKLKIFFAVGKPPSLIKKAERSENFFNYESKPFCRTMCPRSVFENEIIFAKAKPNLT